MNKNFVEVYDNILSEDFCRSIIDFFENNHDMIIEERRKGVNQDIISNPNKWQRFGISHELISFALQESFRQYTDKYNFCPNDFKSQDGYKIQKSEPGKGFTSWHCEDGRQVTRNLVWMIYLNECETGYTQFFHQGLSIQPKPGRCVIWPSSWTHTHRSSPDLKDTKYIMTGWWVYK